MKSFKTSGLVIALLMCLVGLKADGDSDDEGIDAASRRLSMFSLDSDVGAMGRSNSIASSSSFTDELSALLRKGYLAQLQLRVLSSIRIDDSHINTVLFSPDGRYIALGAGSKVYIFTTTDLQHLVTFSDCSGTIIAFSPDSDCVALACGDTVQIWGIESRTCLSMLDAGANSITSLAFSPQGERFAAASGDGTIRMWNFPGYEFAAVLTGHTSPVNSIAFSPNGNYLISGSGYAAHDLRHPFSKNGDNTVRLWNVTTGQCEQKLERHTTPVVSVSFAAAGACIVSKAYQRDVEGVDQGLVIFWNLKTKQCMKLTGNVSFVNSSSFSPGGAYAASAALNNRIQFLDLANKGKLLQTLNGHEAAIVATALSLDGRYLASVSCDGVVKVWGYAGTEAEALAVCNRALTKHLTKSESFRRSVSQGASDFTESLQNMKRRLSRDGSE
jgi:WD40 repeat protein